MTPNSTDRLSMPPIAPEERALQVRPTPGSEDRSKNQSDIFAEAVARMMREQREAEMGEVPSVLHRRPGLLLAGQLAVAVASAAAVALIYVSMFSSSSGGESSALHMWQSVMAMLPAAPRRAPTLMVRNESGLVNETLPLGISVERADAGATVNVKGLPANARLTAGVPTSLTEWRVPAEQVADAKVIPPSDYVGAIDLSAELRNGDGSALVTSMMQLTWRAVAAPPAPSPPVTTAAVTAAPQPAAPPQPLAPTVRELTTNEIAALVRRGQEMLATGDVREARALLTRAAEAHDARAALILAKTFDPSITTQQGASDPGPDLAQARSWYQRARELGSPEAQRQLDALASYR